MKREYQFGKIKVELYSNVTKEESKNNLIKVYDVINKIADKKRKQGIDVSDWFYTKEQLESMKKNGNYEFI